MAAISEPASRAGRELYQHLLNRELREISKESLEVFGSPPEANPGCVGLIIEGLPSERFSDSRLDQGLHDCVAGGIGVYAILAQSGG